ncbi:hypothetical protein K0M31_001855 [Melipona bicolor]|uniref:Uncharacterized protein n=1 Tax=Melipona bicolor TaxID=60889 RepID=A0AA40KY96_9HYME|nr:hypothetical protein K0M31_001855 [Melipona bicolor]
MSASQAVPHTIVLDTGFSCSAVRYSYTGYTSVLDKVTTGCVCELQPIGPPNLMMYPEVLFFVSGSPA